MKKKVITAVATVAILSGTYAGMASASSYQVQKGDTLWQIALKNQTTVNEIKTLNSLKSYFIYPNQTLKLSAAAVATPAAPVTVPAPANTTSEYTVKSGDYLIKIATQFGITVAELKSLNGLTSDMIYVGDKLKVSSQVAVVTPPPVVQPPANGTTTPPSVVPTPPVSSTPSPSPTVTEYTIVSGDTLSRIGLQFGVSVQQLKSLNGLSSDRIYVGQKLKVTTSGTPTTPPALPVADSELITVAKSLMGIPYAWGGSTTSGFDCSGFIYYVLNKSGHKIGRTSAAGYYARTYYVDQPQPGDLVFFVNTYKQGISHVGFYIGNNQFIQADSTHGVTITSLDQSYFKAHFDGFKRLY